LTRYYIPYLPLLGLALAMPLAPETVLGRSIVRILPLASAALMVAGVVVDVTSFWVFDVAP